MSVVNTSPLSRNSWSSSSARKHRVQGAGHLLDALCFLGRQAVEVLVHRLARVDAVLDAVEAGHQQGRKSTGRGCRRIGRAELNAL